MASQQERKELDARAKQGETVVPGGTGGKSLEAQEHLAEGIYIQFIICAIIVVKNTQIIIGLCILFYISAMN